MKEDLKYKDGLVFVSSTRQLMFHVRQESMFLYCANCMIMFLGCALLLHQLNRHGVWYCFFAGAIMFFAHYYFKWDLTERYKNNEWLVRECEHKKRR